MKRGILHILAANIVYLAVNILNSFLLPKFLSVESYAVLKTYTLYIGYAGFLSLGYADGMYLKYGGENMAEVDYSDLSSSYKSFAVLEFAAGLVCTLAAVFMRDFVLAMFAAGSFCINLIGYYKNFYQAVGAYRLYGRALNYQTILLFAVNVALLFLLRTDDARIYIGAQVVTALSVMLYLTFLLNHKTSFMRRGKVSLSQIKENVSSGFTLMLGNFSSSIFTGLDRWFVKLLMTSVHFAYYSFAVSLENILNVFITPITVSLYNIFCKNRQRDYVYRIKKLTLLWGFLIIAAAFPVKFILSTFLTEYMDAAAIIFPLFAAHAFYTIIKGIHVNLYKARRQQKRYFILMIALTAVAVLLNGVLYAFLKTAEAFAAATFLTALLWFIYCELESRDIAFHWKEYLAVLILTGTYFICSGLESWGAGLGIYALTYGIVALLLLRDTLQYVLRAANSMLVHRK